MRAYMEVSMSMCVCVSTNHGTFNCEITPCDSQSNTRNMRIAQSLCTDVPNQYIIGGLN